VHAAPTVHGPHVPLSQTWLVPQELPLGRLPVEVHTGSPVEQSVWPDRHGLVGEHVAPCVHAPHVPLWQTSLVPHDVPLETLPVGLQTGKPVEQSVVPVWQGLPVEHAVPALHAPQTPLWQT